MVFFIFFGTFCLSDSMLNDRVVKAFNASCHNRFEPPIDQTALARLRNVEMCELKCVTEEQQESSACLLRLSGDLNISNAQKLHQRVLETCETFPEVRLLLHDVTAFDVSAIQILIAAVHTPVTKVIVQIGDGAECVTHWLNLSGLSAAVFTETVSAEVV